jgi:CheY-like chemotaxis protein
MTMPVDVVRAWGMLATMTGAAQGETMKGHASPMESDLRSFVVRAIKQVGAEERADAILAAALAVVALDDVPIAAAPLTCFVLGPLFDAVMRSLGVEAAERVIRIMRPWLQKRSENELGDAPESSDKPVVLVVDSDLATRAQVLSILSGQGYDAISAPDGNVALAMSVRARPDLIISDLGVGHANGRQLAALLRVAFHEDAPPIVILTDDPSWRESSRGVCVLPKPIERASLLAAVEPLLANLTPPPLSAG